MRPGWEGIFAVRLVRAWVWFYTRGLPARVAEARRAEIDSDVWEQLRDASRAGRPVPSFALLGRFVRGVPDDLAWRLEREPLSGSPVQRVVLPVVVVLSYGWLAFVWMNGWLSEQLVWWFLLLPVLVTAPILALYVRRCSGRLARAALALILGGGVTVALMLAMLVAVIFLEQTPFVWIAIFVLLGGAAALALILGSRVTGVLMLAVLAAAVYFDSFSGPWRDAWIPILALLGGFAALIGLLAFGVANLYERALPRWNALPLVVAVFPLAAALPQYFLLFVYDFFYPRSPWPRLRFWDVVNLVAVVGFVAAYSALMYVIWRDTFGKVPSDETTPQA